MKFNFVWLPEFLIQIRLGIWTYSQKESCSIWIYLPRGKVWKFLNFRKLCFVIFKVGTFELKRKIMEYWTRSLLGQPTRGSASPPLIWNRATHENGLRSTPPGQWLATSASTSSAWSLPVIHAAPPPDCTHGSRPSTAHRFAHMHGPPHPNPL
jgi:hypothetical protein